MVDDHELELKVNLDFSVPPLPGWAEDEEETGKGEIMATITEISNFLKNFGSEAKLGEI